MTESSENGNYMVRVRAQVMSRDDSSGGWVPLEGGGLSHVSVRKRPRPVSSVLVGDSANKSKHDYLIYGKRISDQSIVLSCTIKKDFEYNKVMPTFHHWKTGDKKFGLTFQTAADARAFDKGVRTAVEELLDGYTSNSPSATTQTYSRDAEDDDVFMTLNLPQDAKESHSSSDSSTKEPEDYKKFYITKKLPGDVQQLPYDPAKIDKGENYSYVQLTAAHEYNYPIVEEHQISAICKRDMMSNSKKCSIEVIQAEDVGHPVKVKQKVPMKTQILCRYCNQYYYIEDNPKGSCEYAPDCLNTPINIITCIGCAQCICYHCARDAEGNYARQPCSCRNDDEKCVKRWVCLTFLSFLLPCLWLYPPLKMCHWCCVRCGLCGGRHSM